jgi:hypothetical protein
MTKPENEKMVESFYSAVEEQMKLITEIKQESSDDFKKTEEEKSIENSNTVIDKLK